jgi:hypothetical protein
LPVDGFDLLWVKGYVQGYGDLSNEKVNAGGTV